MDLISDPATALTIAIADDRSGRREIARMAMREVACSCPDWDEPLLRLAESLRAGGETEAATDAYWRVLALRPLRTEALVALGGLLLLQGRAAMALPLLLRACGLVPDDDEAWNALGLSLQTLGGPSGANPAFGNIAYAAFGNASALRPGRLGYAMARIDAGMASGLDEAEIYAGAGKVAAALLLERQGRTADAIVALEQAATAAPHDPEPLRHLGVLLSRNGHVAAAEAVLHRLRGLCPGDPKARNDHAVMLMRLHRHAEARVLLLDAQAEGGQETGTLCNLANATVCCGLQDEAVAIARQAIALDPGSVLARRALCNTLPYSAGTTGTDLLAAMRACSDVLPRQVLPLFAGTRDPDRRLTVGLLSGTLRSHPVGWLTAGGIEHLDPAAFRIVCLSQIPPPDADPIARRFRALAEEWIDVGRMDDLALARCARDRGVDILLELGGYGDAARMPACAHRLAPVQIKWVGMQAHSSGLAEMDWFLTDRWETPDGFEAFYSERLLRLPDGYICYSPPPYAPPVAPLPATRNGFATFGCFNNLAKIGPGVLAAWTEVLRRVPDSRLVLQAHQLSDAAAAGRLVASFAAAGIAADRVETRGSLGHRAMLEAYGDIDIALDPFPYSGGLTTCEALWMGVPVVTMPGEIFASRHSASHLSNAGLADWVCDSIESYVGLAAGRASDVAGMDALRAALRDRVGTSPLCDAPRFGQSLSAALRSAWRDYCS
jgi:predicted O-linked N-acetylglucosamine transferase (SPINDLY family)